MVLPLWVLYALLSAAFAALVGILGKIGISSVDATLATAVRSVIMAGVVVTAALVSGKAALFSTLNSRALTFIALAGLAGAFSWLFYFVALKHGPVPGVAALDRLSVVFVLVFAVTILGDQLTWKLGVGALLITAGAMLMSIK